MATRVITMELLGPGAHADPRHGSNVLELASVLAGERWQPPTRSRSTQRSRRPRTRLTIC